MNVAARAERLLDARAELALDRGGARDLALGAHGLREHALAVDVAADGSGLSGGGRLRAVPREALRQLLPGRDLDGVHAQDLGEALQQPEPFQQC